MSYTFRQYDTRWGSKNYNGSSTMSAAGCGPTSCADLIYNIDPTITPWKTALWMKNHGYAIRNQGTAHAGIPACLNAYSCVEVQEHSTMASAFAAMKKGHKAIILFRGGTRGGVTWTTQGHFLAATAIKTQNGKTYLYMRDPGARKHDGYYCYETTMKGLVSKIWTCYAGVAKVTKPTGKYDGKINKKDVKKGDKNDSVKYWQKFINWYMGKAVLTTDGDFGDLTEQYTKSFQRTEGLKVDGVVAKYTRNRAYSYLKKKQTVTPSSTTGEKLAAKAIELAWDYDTSSKTTSYKHGRPTNQFKAALHKVYPGYKGWGWPPRLGASCDVGVGTVVRATGYDTKFPRGGGFGYDNKADEQWGHLEKSDLWKRVYPKSYSDLQPGDIVIVCKNRKKHTGHIWMALGGSKMAEAGYARIYWSLHKKAKSRFNMSGTRRVYRAEK